MRRAFLSALLLATSSLASDVPRSECFPIERLESQDRVLATQLLQDALDSNALYTLITGLKPITTAWQQTPRNLDTELSTHFRLKAGDLGRLVKLERLLAALSCGDDLQSGAVALALTNNPSQERVVWPWIAHRQGIRNILTKNAELYGKYFVTPAMNPSAMLQEILTSATRVKPDSDRMLGHLLGYPRYAVEFYAVNGQQRSATGEAQFGGFAVDEDRGVGAFKTFHYTVPKDHTTPNAEDLEIRSKAKQILAEYGQRRPRYIGEGKPGTVELLRDWFCDSKAMCNPAGVRVKSSQ